MISNKRKITLLLVVAMIVSVISISIASATSPWLVTDDVCFHWHHTTWQKSSKASYTSISDIQHKVFDVYTATCKDCGAPITEPHYKTTEVHGPWADKTEQVTPHLTKKYRQCTKCGYKTTGTVVYH